PMKDLSDLKARVLAAAREEPSPTRQMVVRRDAALIAAAIAGSTGIFLAVGGIRMAPRPPLLMIATSLGAAVIAGASVWLSMMRGGSMTGRPRVWLLVMALAVPAMLLVWKMGWSA